MNKSILIACDDKGQYSVGEVPMGGQPDEQEPQEPEMQPAKDLDDALSMAKDMFSAPSEEDAEGEAAFAQGYNDVAGGGMPQGLPMSKGM